MKRRNFMWGRKIRGEKPWGWGFGDNSLKQEGLLAWMEIESQKGEGRPFL